MTVLDLPPPPSVNSTRRINWAKFAKYARWRTDANKLLLTQKLPKPWITYHRFEIHIILSESSRLDLDNVCKAVIDYLRWINLIENDAQKNMRKLTVEWGDAPEGCRVIVTPLGG